ncbi:hypothetical protein HYU06_02395 [Candidatus Woesearchaeota archaeon]|nr:hypothetical protein [Candidatus Woesearchaeota archaeon]
MALDLVLEREGSTPLKLYVVGYNTRRERLDKVPDKVDLVFVDSSFFDFNGSNSDRSMECLEKAFRGSMVFLEDIVDEINNAPQLRRRNRRLKRAIDSLIEGETKIDSSVILSHENVQISANTLQTLEGALPKKIAYQNFIAQFSDFYALAERLAIEYLPKKIEILPWGLRKDRVRRVLGKIWREGNRQIFESGTENYNRLARDSKKEYGTANRLTLNFVYHELLPRLPGLVYAAINNANETNGHITTFPGLREGIPIYNSSWLFKTYWVNAYLGCINIMLRRTMHCVINGFTEEKALKEVKCRFNRDLKTDNQLVAAATQYRVNGKNRRRRLPFFSEHKSIYQAK